MQNPQMPNIYSLIKDLNSLYVTTKDKRIESLFIYAEKSTKDTYSNVVDWIRDILKKNRQGYFRLHKQENLDVLFHLLSTRRQFPTGISASDFYKNIAFDPNLKPYLPTMISLRKAYEQNHYYILEPFEDILMATKHLNLSETPTGESSLLGVLEDLEKLESDYRNFINKSVNKPFSDTDQKAKRVTKKERIRNLTDYLARRFSSEIATAFSQVKHIDTVGIATEPMFLKDPVLMISKMFPNYTKASMDFAVYIARNIIKEIGNQIDPVYYNDIFNYIRNRILQTTHAITEEEFRAYLYRRNLDYSSLEPENSENEDPEIHEETISHNVAPQTWLNPDAIVIVSSVLYLLNLKANNL